MSGLLEVASLAPQVASLGCSVWARSSWRALAVSVVMTIGMLVVVVPWSTGGPSVLAGLTLVAAAGLTLRRHRSAVTDTMNLHRGLSTIAMGGLLILSAGHAPDAGAHHVHTVDAVLVLLFAAHLVFSAWLGLRPTRHGGRVGIAERGEVLFMGLSVGLMVIM